MKITTLEGLKTNLRSLGFGDATAGIDFEDTSARKVLEDNINWSFGLSKQTANDVRNRDRALEQIGLYPWKLKAVLSSLSTLRSLLEEEQVLEPVEVVDIIEDDEGNAETIEVIRSVLAEVNRLLD